MLIQKIVGRNIRRIRESKGWSQCKLSEESGLHYTYISGIERGVRNPTINIVFRIAIALNINFTELFEQVDGRIFDEQHALSEEKED